MTEEARRLAFYLPPFVALGMLACEIVFGVAVNGGWPILVGKTKRHREYWTLVVFHAVIAGLVVLFYGYLAIAAPESLPAFW